MTNEGPRIQILDVTLRDGEQTQGVSFSEAEKVSIAHALLDSLKVDRIEIASAGVSAGEREAVTQINEQTLSFIPKILVIVGAVVICAPWMSDTLVTFTRELIISIPEVVMNR